VADRGSPTGPDAGGAGPVPNGPVPNGPVPIQPPEPTGSTLTRTRMPALIELLGRDHLDPGYAEAARRRAADPEDRGPSRASRTTTAVIGLLVAGLLFGIAAGTTDSNAERTEFTRSALLEDIGRAQQQQADLAAEASRLAGDLRATQAQLGAAGPLQTVADLERASGQTAVHGPGLRIVIDEPDTGGATASGAGVILDRDIQLLVNDLWAAGAEAIAVGGVRLRTTSAIRQAGGSILVDNRPVSWPIDIDAIGDAAGMQVALVGTAGFGRFSSLAQLYGVRFDVGAQPDMVLPAGTGSDLRFAGPTASPTSAAAWVTPSATVAVTTG